MHLSLLCARCNGVGMTTATLTDKIVGALASQEIRQALYEDGWTNLKLTPERESRIEPANADVMSEDECWRVPDGFKPERGVSVLESLRRLNPRERPRYKFAEANGHVAYRDFSWLFPIEGTWKLPQNFFIRASPKSTEGRMGNLNRLVADGVPKYDVVPKGFQGKMYALVKPFSFNNLVFPGFPFLQLRAYCKERRVLSDDDLRMLINQQGLVRRNERTLSVDEIEIDKGLLNLLPKNPEQLLLFKTLYRKRHISEFIDNRIDFGNNIQIQRIFL